MTIKLDSRGSPYSTVNRIADSTGLSTKTIRTIISEIEACKRYSGHWLILNDFGTKLVNTLMMEDYLHYRGQIKAGLEKHLPPYDPKKAREERGEV